MVNHEVLTAPVPPTLPAAQQPEWPDPAELAEVLGQLARSPALVAAPDCDELRGRLGEVATRRAFLIQAGDCAETFAQAKLVTTARQARLLAMMAERVAAAGLPVVTVGRIAGQYAKPRSAPTETRGPHTLPAYRGDAVNGREFTAGSRTPDARRLLGVYAFSATTLADLAELRVAPATPFTSHEALLLGYEEALARRQPDTGRRYATSGHLLWIGERTRQPTGAHVAFLAGVDNPVAVKIGPTAPADEVLRLVDLLDPDRVPGRLTLIARMGADVVRHALPPLVAAVRDHGSQVAWVCDPMHGNTVRTRGGVKTRVMDTIAEELVGFFEVHRELNTHPGGVHLEVTGSPVTECVGGTPAVREQDVPLRYETACDPRLNHDQALEMSELVAGLLKESLSAASKWGVKQ